MAKRFPAEKRLVLEKIQQSISIPIFMSQRISL